MKKISGGVCAAKGFTAAGIHAGVKAGSNPEKNDLALILSDCECALSLIHIFNLSHKATMIVARVTLVVISRCV